MRTLRYGAIAIVLECILLPAHAGAESEIHAAARAGDDKIKITWTQLSSSGTTLPWMRQPGERWEAVLIKSGNRYRTLSAKREDGKKISVEDGFLVRPSPDVSSDQLPTSWVRTANETPWFEKCAATADDVVLSGVTVRSALSGYAVTFPSKPVEDVKDTPAGKVVINFARDGYTMFAASEATTDLPDTSTGLEFSVASFVQSFPGAAVTSKQKTEFTAASGRALPAITFTFASASHNFFGEGIVVAAGRYLISVVGTDMDTSTNPRGKRPAIRRFVSSLKIEK